MFSVAEIGKKNFELSYKKLAAYLFLVKNARARYKIRPGLGCTGSTIKRKTRLLICLIDGTG